MQLYHWLVDEGIYRDLLAAIIGVVVGHVFAWRPLKKLYRRHAEQQEKIADLLDTGSPGGLSEVVKELKNSR